ncbi:MAG: hypothetical protein WC605_07175, partial [Bacteroidales bacterium]
MVFLQSYSLTVLPSYSLTVLQSYSLTVLPSYRPTCDLLQKPLRNPHRTPQIVIESHQPGAAGKNDRIIT